MFKYLFKRDTVFATIMVFLVMGLLSLIPLNTHVLDPIKMALQDFDYNDMAYSKFGKNSHTGVDTNIVIVNIEDAGRSEIVSILQKIIAQRPAAIGVDVLFNQPKQLDTDTTLRNLFIGPNKLVMAYDLSVGKEVAYPKGLFYNSVGENKGYANFIAEENGTIRYFNQVYTDKQNKTYESFAAKILMNADEARYRSFMKKQPAILQINYTRSPDKYITLSGRHLLEGESDIRLLTGKIVLVGYISEDPNSIEDKHFTPFNKKSVGKSVPDMPGVIIHANILSMMNSGDYISKWPGWLVWTLAVFLCWIHMALFIRYFVDKHIWFHLVAKIAQIISAVLIVYLGLLFFYKWDIKINLTPSFVAIILAVDVLYFYEAIVAWLHKKFGFHSLFVHHAH